MAILQRFDPPAYLPDFVSISGQLDAWHTAVSNWFDGAVANDISLVAPGPFQFYNPALFDPGGAVIEQAITWNAFPKELLRLFGRDRALVEADQLWTLDRYYSDLGNIPVDPNQYPALFKTYFRPQDEYCEWHVTRDAQTGKIVRVTFSSEPPEFWYALFGSSVPNDDSKFPGDRNAVLQGYQAMVSDQVKPEDLVAPFDIPGPSGDLFGVNGQYNVYNKWNTTHGIVHLCAPPNSLMAEIQLGADATVLRQNSECRLLVEPEALICCAGYGGPDRNSDPTIGAAVNALARLGAYITLRNPVGLYMDHIDLSGWEAPDGAAVQDCVQILRGMPQMIERMVVEVPEERGFTVSDLRIGGVPISYGGQIAECITVKLVGIANLLPKGVQNAPADCTGRCCVDPNYATRLVRSVKFPTPLPPGTKEAFVDEGASEAQLVPVGKAMAEEIAETPRHIPRKSMLRRRRVIADE